MDAGRGAVKVAVISGGAGGLGLALSAAMQARGWQVWLLDRETGHVEDSDTQRVVVCDLTDPDQLAAACTKVIERAGRIDLAVYNAGITHIGAFDQLDPATHRRVFEINYFAAVNMAQHMLVPLRQSRGTHLAISSVAGFSPLYRRTAYAASKHALEGFFHSLRSEESVHGVRVQVAAPSFVATNIGRPERGQDGTARPGSAADGVDYMTPQDAAQAILRGMDRGTPMIPVGRIARLAWWINRLSPRLFQHLMERKIRG